MDELIWVDGNNNVVGFGEKMETHITGQLHRAFSIFIFDKEQNKVLLQRRALTKYHSGGLWTNACCSHPKKNEHIADALINRLRVELGLVLPSNVAIVWGFQGDTPLDRDKFYHCGTFQYCATFDGLTENEIDQVFVLVCRKSEIDCCFNKDEVEEVMWLDIQEVDDWMRSEPESFTVWFRPAFECIKNCIDTKRITNSAMVSTINFE